MPKLYEHSAYHPSLRVWLLVSDPKENYFHKNLISFLQVFSKYSNIQSILFQTLFEVTALVSHHPLQLPNSSGPLTLIDQWRSVGPLPFSSTNPTERFLVFWVWGFFFFFARFAIYFVTNCPVFALRRRYTGMLNQRMDTDASVDWGKILAQEIFFSCAGVGSLGNSFTLE